MSSIFKPIDLEWDGADYTIPADQILPLVAEIESKITFMELAAAMNNQVKLPIATLSMVYGKVLRHAGAVVTDEEIYAGLFAADTKEAVMAGIHTLMIMMMPPGVYAEAEKNMDARAATVIAKKTNGSSNRPSKRSAVAKARRSNRVNSGA